jgi:hypothetical protein
MPHTPSSSQVPINLHFRAISSEFVPFKEKPLRLKIAAPLFGSRSTDRGDKQIVSRKPFKRAFALFSVEPRLKANREGRPKIADRKRGAPRLSSMMQFRGRDRCTRVVA